MKMAERFNSRAIQVSFDMLLSGLHFAVQNQLMISGITHAVMTRRVRNNRGAGKERQRYGCNL